MDVFFEVQRGKTFSIEVGYFDSVLEIKEKVHKYHGIPVSKQTLIFKGQFLQDNDDVLKCEIFHNSRIQLLVAPDTDKPPPPPPPLVKREEVPSPPPTKIHLNVKAVSSNNAHLPLEMDVNDSILRLKEKIHEMEGVPVNRLILHARGNELHDHQLLRDCDVSDNSEIGASLRPLPPSGGGSNGGGSGSGGLKKLKMTVFAKNGTRKIPVEVNAMDNVGELRKELHKLNQRMQFPLPQEGYFFIYNQNVMDDDKSFRWHHVGQGDSIEVFNGSVTGGS